jgi:hypothetical protein
MKGGRKQAKPDVARPLNGRVRRHSHTLCFSVQLRGRYGARFVLLDNESGHSPSDGISDVAGFVHHALGIVVSLAGRDAARLLPF